MVDPFAGRAVVIGTSSLERPDAREVASVRRAGGFGVLDLGAGDVRTREELDLARQWVLGRFGVRVPAGCQLSRGGLPDTVDTVVLGKGAPWRAADLAADYRVLAEVTNRDEAARAARAGAHGLIALGHESGGPAGELSSFVLLQQLVADDHLPVWLRGGIGPRTAAAAVVGGAAGVVVDARDVGGVRAAVLAALDEEHARVAAAVLRADSALCQAIGCELPVAQGPMTRVSDQAGFAASVAGHGALPFVALALATGEQTRTLLEQTRPGDTGPPLGCGCSRVRAGGGPRGTTGGDP